VLNKITKTKMETTNIVKGYTKKEFVKKLLMISLGIMAFSGVMAFGFDALSSNPYDDAVRERNKIEVQMKIKKQEIMVKAEAIEVVAKEHEAMINEFEVLSNDLNSMRESRDQATEDINNWINEGFDLSQ
jgi:hypothetical protein